VTGGGAYLSGLRERAEHVLSRPCRLGRPVGFGALDEGAQAAGFAVAAGLLRYMADPPAEAVGATENAEEPSAPSARLVPLSGSVGGAVGKAWSWLKENF
jgi:cell division ATPase FtsA